MDWSKISETQRRVLDEIGCGNHSPIAAKSTINALLDKGFIFELSPVSYPVIGSLRITVRRFDMPIAVHMEWCDICACECDEKDHPNEQR